MDLEGQLLMGEKRNKFQLQGKVVSNSSGHRSFWQKQMDPVGKHQAVRSAKPKMVPCDVP